KIIDMKILKFEKRFIQPILEREKTTTWRMFDDKNLTEGDKIILTNQENGEEFCKAKIVDVKEKQLKDINEDYYEGHESFESIEKICSKFSEYYNKEVNQEDKIKIIRFVLESD
ncbi:MAG: ASCH domain-containing protein, partial [Nanoarchaeota archaeon]|nr:ASCH domain-containing protein [Nanoarchaeota archaeon]